jgi:hypothetical protein
MPTGRMKRSDRARGLRTLQHQKLAAATRYAIDTEVWYRGLIAEREGRLDPGWATKDQVHDEAIAWFLARHRRKPFAAYAAARDHAADLTFWVDSKLIERARRMAVRDGVKLARLIEAALGSYVEQHVSDELIAFRRWIHQKACDLYRSNQSSSRRASTRAASTRRRRAH